MNKCLLEVQEIDRAMEEIEDLYTHMFALCQGPRGTYRNIHPEIKSRLHKRILEEIESIREVQRGMRFGYQDYWEMDRKIRRRLLKEIQIIIDAYVIAKEENRLGEWEFMYGDIEHYKRDFFYFRMDPDYENLRKSLNDYKFIEDN